MSTIIKGSHVSQPERFCKYVHRFCNQIRLDGYDYCIRHILEDKTSPFRQCMYINQPNKKRCTNAAPKGDKTDRQDNTLCPFHAKRALMKTRSFHSKRRHVSEGETTLERYRDGRYSNKAPTVGGGQPSNLEQVEAAFEDGESVLNEARIENIDEDFSPVENVSHCLAHAGVYTYKEICTIAREKIIKLQHLYCDELKVLYRELNESRRRFLKSVAKPVVDAESEEQKSPKLVYRDLKEVKGRLLARIEKPSTSSALGADPDSSPIDMKLMQAYRQYHCRTGTQRIFRRKVLERRAKLNKPAKPTCTFVNSKLRCMLPALVATKFCKNHILSDPNQVLYIPCGETNCTIPVLPIEDKVSCDRHFSCVLAGGYKLEEAVPEPAPQDLPLENSLIGLTAPETEHFQSMDDIASLGLDAIAPGSLFGLDQFGEPGESTDTVRSLDPADLMQIQAISLNPPSDILSESESE